MTKALFVACRSSDMDGAGWGPVARLEYDGKVYRFCYLRGARTLPGFRPFTGMGDLNEVYESESLFPVFENRLLSKARTEYDAFLRWGGFDPNNPPDPISILGVTEGIRQTDAIEVFPCPRPDAHGEYINKFFLHGIRWMGHEAIDRIGALAERESLYLLPEPSNAVDPNAVGVYTDLGTYWNTDQEACSDYPFGLLAPPDTLQIGFVPRYFAYDFQALMKGCGPEWGQLWVERINPDAPLQHRVLCRIRACWPQGFEPCSGDTFLPISADVPARCE